MPTTVSPHLKNDLWQLAQAGLRPGIYDEMCDTAQAALRPVWSSFAQWMGEKPLNQALWRHQNAINQQIVSNGITYNVYTDSGKTPVRPWALDVLPLLLTSADWSAIGAGIIERAVLLNQMMQDAYGPQHLMQKGLLPPALLYGNPGFLRPMQGYQPPHNIWLHLVAFDLARTPNGQWWVVNHRIQAPSGLGYVLENRLAIARVFSEGFRELKIHHIASFYNQYLETLRTLSPAGGSARIALLTPGPFNETYFEQAYLARYLGITLVESHDLQVRDNKVFLKTVKGLQRIHALIRRVDDEWVDPVELKTGSHLGVPGLLQAIRAQEVLVVNPPGGGWLESPAIHGFLPAIARHLQGRNLQLPSVPSWWCGEASAWGHAANRMDQLVIKATSPDLIGDGMKAVLGSNLDDCLQRHWQARISARPDAYTLQELLPLSQIPVWRHDHFERRSLMVRVYAASDGRGSYTVLPGGLTRISGNDDPVISMQHGGSSVDTWILDADTKSPLSLVQNHLCAKEVRALQRPVSSTAAEHLFWLGRYSERAEYQLRLLKHILKLLREEDIVEPTTRLFVTTLCARQGVLLPSREMRGYDIDSLEADLIRGMGDIHGKLTGTTSLGFNIAQLSRVAGYIRDRLSVDHWRWVSESDSVLRCAPIDMNREEALEHLSRLRRLLSAICGEQSDHMTRDDGWRFMTLGRHLERLSAACDVLLTLMENPADILENALELLVSLGDSIITYRARYQHRFEWLPCLDLMVFDESNPRSLKRIAYKIKQAIGKLPGDTQALSEVLEPVAKMPVELSLENLQLPCAQPNLDLLKTWLKTQRQLTGFLSERVAKQYFRLAGRQNHLI